MKLMAIVLAVLITPVYLLFTTGGSFPQIVSEKSKGNKPNRIFIQSRFLYVQALDDPHHLATVFRLPIDKPEVVERIHFPLNSVSKRLGPWMRISGSDIYILRVSDMGGAQFSVGIQKFSFNDIIRGAGDYLRPVQIPSTIGMITKREGINIDPLRDALFRDILPFSLKTKSVKPPTIDKNGKLINPAENFRVWFDLSIPGDGFLYLYIFDEEELSIWKRDLMSFGRPDDSIKPGEISQKNYNNARHISPFWQKSMAIEGIPPEAFWVANDGNLPIITTASGKVYHLQGENLINKANSFTPLVTAVSGVTGTEIQDSTTVYIDDLDSGEQWSVSLDATGKAVTRTHHLKKGSLNSEELPANLSNALQKALPLTKIGKYSRW